MAKKDGLSPRKDPKQDRSQATLEAILQATAQILSKAEEAAGRLVDSVIGPKKVFYERAIIRYFCQVDTEIAAFLVTHALRSAVLLTILQKPERLHSPVFRDELTQMIVRYLKPS